MKLLDAVDGFVVDFCTITRSHHPNSKRNAQNHFPNFMNFVFFLHVILLNIISEKCGMNSKSKTQRAIPNFVRVVVLNTFDDLKTKSVWQMAKNVLCKARRREKTEFYFQIIDRNADIYLHISTTWATNSKMDDAEWIRVNRTLIQLTQGIRMKDPAYVIWNGE